MILQLSPRNTDSDQQRDGRQRHADGADSTVHVSYLQLPIHNHLGSHQSSPGFGIAYIQDTAESWGRRIISCILLQQDVSVVPPGCVRRHGLALPDSFPQAFPRLQVQVMQSRSMVRLGSWRALSTGSLDSSKSSVWPIPPRPCLHTKTVGTTELAY